jgi:hypothetical protein
VKNLLVVYFVIGALFSPFGYFWHTTVGKAGDNIHFDRVHELKRAHIGVDERLYLCVRGIHNKEDTEYWIYVPVNTLANAPESVDMVHGHDGYWKLGYRQIWNLPRLNIKNSRCSSPPFEIKRDVKIKTIEGAMTTSFETEDILAEDFEQSAEEELAYQINVTDGSGKPIENRDLAYGNKSLNFERQNVVSFFTDSYTKKGTAAWYLLVPFAWILDVITWPYQLLMWMNYKG